LEHVVVANAEMHGELEWGALRWCSSRQH
jgi:hypothetical protein